MQRLDPALVALVRETSGSERYKNLLGRWLLELVRINTAPAADLTATAAREAELRERICEQMREAAGGGMRAEIAAIPASIENDPDYSFPGYAAGEGTPRPAAAAIYADRANLFIHAGDLDAPPAVILHAHTDVVPPWFDARETGDRIYGRGACDNKAQVALLIAQAMLLRELESRFPELRLAPRLYQFTLDEETGGNGSVAAASDLRYAGLPVLMHDSTDLIPYCAHRGCVYYRCELGAGPNENMSALELFPFVVLALEAEGRKFQRETDYPGFSAAHVQTNQGILGCYGRHPGSVCDHMAVDLTVVANANSDRLAMKLTQYLDEALVEYIARYGDKTQEQDATGGPKLRTHFEVKPLPQAGEGPRVRVDVYGRSGHMAAVRECDNAITKTALLFGALLKNSYKFPGLQAHARLADAPEGDAQRTVVLEGGQGFTPAHSMEQIQTRLVDAAQEAVRKYCKLRGRRFDARMVRVTFERLHNDAYAQSPESPPMTALCAACEAVGHPIGPPTAWITSCDARIYHHKGYPVAVFGAGRLEVAHGDSEYVDLADLQKALAISTLATVQLARK